MMNEFETEKVTDSSPVRTEFEQREIVHKAAFVAKVLARRSDMMVIPGSDWAANLSPEVQQVLDRGTKIEEVDSALLEPKILTYPKEDLLERSEDYILGVTRHEVGHFLHSDFRAGIDFQTKVKAEGKNPYDAHTLNNAIEDGRVNGLLSQESNRARERIAMITKEDLPQFVDKISQATPPIQFCGLALVSWAEGYNDSTLLEEVKAKITSEKARAVFEEAQPFISQAVREKSAKKMMHILETEIWPRYRDLVEDYLDNPNQEQDQKPEQPEQGQDQSGQNQGQGQQQGEKGEDKEESSGSQEASRKTARERLDKESEEFNRQFGPKSMAEKKDEEGVTHLVPQKTDPKDKEDWQKATEEIRKEEEKSRARERQRQGQEAEKSRSQAAGLTERRTGLTEGERAKYDQFLAEMKPYLNQLLKRLDEIFPKEETYSWQKGKARGTRIEPRRIAREVSTSRGLFFEKKEVAEKPQVVCSILLDCSGSMYGQTLELAVKEMIMIAEALSKKEIDFELIAFSDTPEPIKDFNDQFSGVVKKRMIGLLNSGGSGTATGRSVDFAALRLAKQMKNNRLPGFMVVHTDGLPGDNLTEILEKWQGRFPIIGIGVGEEISREAIKEYFGEAGRYTANPVEAPREIVDVLKSQFARYKNKQ